MTGPFLQMAQVFDWLTMAYVDDGQASAPVWLESNIIVPTEAGDNQGGDPAAYWNRLSGSYRFKTLADYLKWHGQSLTDPVVVEAWKRGDLYKGQDDFLGRYGPMVVASIVGAGMWAGGALGGEIASSAAVNTAAAADASAGLLPAYGSNAAYAAGIAAPVDVVTTQAVQSATTNTIEQIANKGANTVDEFLNAQAADESAGLIPASDLGYDPASFYANNPASQASAPGSLNSIMGQGVSYINSGFKAVGSAVAAIGHATQNNGANRYTVGSGQSTLAGMNLTLPLLALGAFFLLKG